MAEALGCGHRTVERVRERFVTAGLDAALTHKPQDKPSRTPVLDGQAEARLVALACAATPDGGKAWTLRLLADKLVELEVVEQAALTIRSAFMTRRSLGLLDPLHPTAIRQDVAPEDLVSLLALDPVASYGGLARIKALE